MFLFGEEAHKQPGNRQYEIYHKWVTDEAKKVILNNIFHETILFYLTAIMNIARVSKKELKKA